VLPELVYLDYLVRLLRQRLADARHDERGMTTETVIITAILAALALAVGAIIVAKVTTKANNIPTGE
jgi:hypothetical protein